MPEGVLVTVPVPCPASVTDICVGVEVKDAVTVVLAFKTTVQGTFPEHAPDHPLNVTFAAGVAVSTTLVPGENEAVHVLPQLMPAGLLVTIPVPFPVSETVS